MSTTHYRFPKKTIRDISVNDKRILLRADFNVPLDENEAITSDYRITQTLPTLKYLLERKAQVIILSHLGRPEGKVNEEFRLQPIATRLSELLGQPVDYVSDCIGDKTMQALKSAKPGTVTLLENTRFYPGEEVNDPEFVQQLLATTRPDYIVQDCFGAIHRAHASTEGISHFVPAVAGLLLEEEITVISRAMQDPTRPLVAVLGGAKISDKLPLVEQFLKKADTVLIGGAMANTFLKEQGVAIGKSVYEEGQSAEIATILQKAQPNQVILPADVAVGKEIAITSQRRDSSLEEVTDDDYILDLGFETMRRYVEEVSRAHTVIWNGTLGYAELPQFAQASAVMAQALSSQEHRITSIIGGGDTADFVLQWQQLHPEAHFTHISTGGGASLELMSGQKLPGVEALIDKKP